MRFMDMAIEKNSSHNRIYSHGLKTKTLVLEVKHKEGNGMNKNQTQKDLRDMALYVAMCQLELRRRVM